MAPAPGRSVFVGNIPYGVSEEQIIDIFSRVGAVDNFRLVQDKETGRPKGFGFLEYKDPDTAAAAVRNLNDHDIMGRKLRVDWSNDSGSGGGGQPAAESRQQTNGLDKVTSTSLPPIPPGIETPNISSPDAISQTLASMPAPQLLDLISQMKGMVAENPAQVQQIFTVAPQLAYAIFQALLLLGLTDTNILSSIVQAAVPAQPPPPQQFQAPIPPPQVPGPNQYAQYQQYQQPVPTPPQQRAYVPPPAPTPAQPDQAAALQQIIAMSREVIMQLPPPQRDQIIAIRASIGHPVT